VGLLLRSRREHRSALARASSPSCSARRASLAKGAPLFNLVFFAPSCRAHSLGAVGVRREDHTGLGRGASSCLAQADGNEMLFSRPDSCDPVWVLSYGGFSSHSSAISAWDSLMCNGCCPLCVSSLLCFCVTSRFLRLCTVFPGTLATLRAAYDRSIELKVATPMMIINYARLLQERQYWEESFKARPCTTTPPPPTTCAHIYIG